MKITIERPLMRLVERLTTQTRPSCQNSDQNVTVMYQRFPLSLEQVTTKSNRDFHMERWNVRGAALSTPTRLETILDGENTC